MTVEKLVPKLLVRPITSKANSAMNQSEFLAITCTLLIARENYAYKLRLVLVLLLIGWKSDAWFLSQSLSVAIAIAQLPSKQAFSFREVRKKCLGETPFMKTRKRHNRATRRSSSAWAFNRSSKLETTPNWNWHSCQVILALPHDHVHIIRTFSPFFSFSIKPRSRRNCNGRRQEQWGIKA